MKFIYIIVVMLILLFIITFSLANIAPVSLSYYGFFDISIPAYLLIFICFGTGVIFTGFLDMAERYRLAKKADKLKKQLKEHEKAHPKAVKDEEEPVASEEEPQIV